MTRIVMVMLVAAAALLSGAGVAQWPHRQQQVLLQQEGVQLFGRALPVTDAGFINQLGQPTRLSDLQGRHLLVFFGYTFCPDVCPTAFMDLGRTWRQLPEAVREQWQVVFVSIDPQRDTPQALAPYMAYFNKTFMALTGNEASLQQLAAELNAVYNKVERAEGQPYLMDHSANLAIIDRQGGYRGYIAPPHGAARMVPLLQALTGTL